VLPSVRCSASSQQHDPKTGRHLVTLVLSNGIIVTAAGDVELATLKAMLDSLDLARIESTIRVAEP
jgi:hypothetical protein